MIDIAIIGFGVVGGGITRVIEKNTCKLKSFIGDDINIKYILDLRDFPDSPYADRVVHDIEIIEKDNSVKVVCETMGGVNPAFDFTMRMIAAGKSVVTSNKELVAKHGVEILNAAKNAGVSYMFEASVGGGIPEIRGMRTSLAGDTISEIDGILNGTTNYILTKMKNEGADFADVLKEAQKLGYAEKNPTADVDGFDAQRKIMILTAVATDYMVKEDDVYRETVTKITPLDMDAASRFNGTIKLIGSSRIRENGVSLFVCPFFIPSDNPLSFIDDVYNGIHITSDVTGDVMYYGRGAGRMPTAGAVVSDVASILSGLATKEKQTDWKQAPDGFVIPFEENCFSYYVRIKSSGTTHSVNEFKEIFGEISILNNSPEGYFEFITPSIIEKEASKLFKDIDGIESVIRVF